MKRSLLLSMMSFVVVLAWASKTRTVYVPNATSGFTASKWGENDNTTVTIKYGEYPTSIKENISTSGFTTQIAKGIATQHNCQVNLRGHGIGVVNVAGISKKIIY